MRRQARLRTAVWLIAVVGCTWLYAVQHPGPAWWEVPLTASVYGLLLGAALATPGRR